MKLENKNKPITALLLSAGFGKRLRPITNAIPKCLVKINKKPIIEHWLIKLENIGCKKVLVNTHYLYQMVEKYLSLRENSSMVIETVYEENLLGTAGTLINNEKFFNNSRVIMIHADNITNFDIKSLLEIDQTKNDGSIITMLTFNTKTPKSCGVVITDENMILKEFYEKSSNPPCNIANGAIYVFDYKFISQLKKYFPLAKDFSKDVIPNFLGKIRTFHTDKLFVDIGTKESLEFARYKFNDENKYSS